MTQVKDINKRHSSDLLSTVVSFLFAVACLRQSRILKLSVFPKTQFGLVRFYMIHMLSDYTMRRGCRNVLNVSHDLSFCLAGMTRSS